MIKLGNYEANFDAQKRLEETEIKMLHNNLIALIEEIEQTILPDVIDMEDTFLFIKKKDEAFAGELWSKYLVKSDTIDVNSYFGFKYKKKTLARNIVVTSKGAGCYYDNNGNEFNKDSWAKPQDIKNLLGIYSKNQLADLIDSAQNLLAHFPSYQEGFFKCVSARQII